MPILENFRQFEGRYWDTASIRNALDYQGVVAPHTGRPYNEAMLLGISGGLAFGYFTFHYQGYDPQVNLLTRNTFDPVPRIFERLGIPVDTVRTPNADKARGNLVKALEAGKAPIARPDMYLLPYNCLDYDEANWGTMPLVIFGYEPGGAAHISDRSRVPLTAAADDLDKARARVKKDRHVLLLLGAPDRDRLPEAISAGLNDTVQLMTAKPPKGSARNFGLKALAHWADMLAKKSRGSWAKEYSAGRACLAAHISAYTFLSPAFGKTMQAERDVYADFLLQAADALGESDLRDVASLYQAAGEAWTGVLEALLPADAPLLGRARGLIDRTTELFVEQGAAQLDEIRACRDELAALHAQAESDFPLSESELVDLRAALRERVLETRAAEESAVLALQAVCATMDGAT